MKHFHLFKRIALACGVAAAVTMVSSCTSTTAPSAQRAEQLRLGTNVTVFSYNDAASPKNRLCTEAGPLPASVAKALDTWMSTSTVKNFSYAYPQYYIAMTTPTGRQRVWAICTDGKANMVGVLVPRDGVAAWDLPFIGAYRMYVCDTAQRRALSDAIMSYLAEAGYDTYRINARKATGLVDEQYLISKPKTLMELEQERLAAEAARKAQEEAARKAAETPATTEDAPEGDEESSEDEEASGDEEESTEEGSDEEGSDEEVSEDEGSEDEEATEDEASEEEPAEEEEEEEASDEEE